MMDVDDVLSPLPFNASCFALTRLARGVSVRAAAVAAQRRRHRHSGSGRDRDDPAAPSSAPERLVADLFDSIGMVASAVVALAAAKAAMFFSTGTEDTAACKDGMARCGSRFEAAATVGALVLLGIAVLARPGAANSVFDRALDSCGWFLCEGLAWIAFFTTCFLGTTGLVRVLTEGAAADQALSNAELQLGFTAALAVFSSVHVAAFTLDAWAIKLGDDTDEFTSIGCCSNKFARLLLTVLVVPAVLSWFLVVRWLAMVWWQVTGRPAAGNAIEANGLGSVTRDAGDVEGGVGRVQVQPREAAAGNGGGGGGGGGALSGDAGAGGRAAEARPAHPARG